MNKTMIIPLVLALALGSCAPSSAKEFAIIIISPSALTGSQWISLTPKEKELYVMGAKESGYFIQYITKQSYDQANSFFSAWQNNRPSLSKMAQLGEFLDSLRSMSVRNVNKTHDALMSTSKEQFILGLNDFYSDYRNLKIPVIYAMQVVNLTLFKTPQDAIDAYIEELRKS